MVVAGFRTVSAALITSGSTQDFTIAGIGTPKGVRIVASLATSISGTVADHRAISMGFSDGTYQGGICGASEDNVASSNTCSIGYDDAIIRQPKANGSTTDFRITFNSWITDGIRVNVPNLPDSAVILDVTLWYGADCSFKAGASNPPLEGDPNDHVTTTFAPDQVLTLSATNGSDEIIHAGFIFQHGMFAVGHTGYSLFIQTDDAQPTMTQCLVSGQGIASYFNGTTAPFTVINSTEFVSFDSTGFNIASSGTAGGRGPSFVWAAISYGGKQVHQSLQQSQTGTGDTNVTGVGFTGGSAMTMQSIVATAWNGNDVSTQRAGSFGFGFFNEFEQGTTATTDEDNSADSNSTSRHTQTALAARDHDGTTGIYEATFVSWIADGFKLNYSVVNATRRKYVVFVVEHDPFTATAAGTLPKFSGTAVAKQVFQASGAGTLPKFSGAAAALQVFRASSAGTLPKFTGNAVAKQVFVASAAGTINKFTGAAQALQVFRSTGAGTLPKFSGSAVARALFQASAAGTLPKLSGSSAALQIFVASAAGTLPRFTGSALALTDVVAQVAGTITHFSGSAQALQVFRSTSLGTLPRFTGTATALSNQIVLPAFGCPVELLGSYSSRVALLASHDDYTVLLGSHDDRSELNGGHDDFAPIGGSYDGVATLKGSACR